MSEAASLVWCDGRSLPADALVATARDSAFAEGCGCYTTMLCEDGVARWAERHARRLVNDALAVGVGELPLERARAAVRDSAKALWPASTGALRLQCTRNPDASLLLVGVPRPLGDDPESWRAISARRSHWGPMPWKGAKVISHWPALLGRTEAQERGADEALLFDASDRLIEGARSNIVVQRSSRELVTPDLARGGVSGLARDVLLDHWESTTGERLRVGDISRRDLAKARAVIAVNSLRPGRPIVELDGEPLGDPSAHALAERIAKVITTAPDLHANASTAPQASAASSRSRASRER